MLKLARRGSEGARGAERKNGGSEGVMDCRERKGGRDCTAKREGRREGMKRR